MRDQDSESDIWNDLQHKMVTWKWGGRLDEEGEILIWELFFASSYINTAEKKKGIPPKEGGLRDVGALGKRVIKEPLEA